MSAGKGEYQSSVQVANALKGTSFRDESCENPKLTWRLWELWATGRVVQGLWASGFLLVHNPSVSTARSSAGGFQGSEEAIRFTARRKACAGAERFLALRARSSPGVAATAGITVAMSTSRR